MNTAGRSADEESLNKQLAEVEDLLTGLKHFDEGGAER